VVDGGGSTRVAIFGDHMAQLAMDHGWQGLIIHGAVRDVDRLRTLDLAVLALGHVPQRGGKSGLGQRGVEVRFGDATFTPGCFACLDGDGVVVLSRGCGHRFASGTSSATLLLPTAVFSVLHRPVDSAARCCRI